jgi:hypothetical protein
MMRFALLASVVTFAGSIAGFHLASAAAVPERAVVRATPAMTADAVARERGDCPHRGGRLWEEA